MQLEFTKLVERERIYKDFTQIWVEELFSCLLKERKLKNKSKLKASELSLVFVSKVKIKKINSEYRKVKKETDVLSFDGDGRVSLGELIFCMEVIKEKAQKVKLPLKLYFMMLLTHGVLHLLGYEHEESAQKEREMFLLQDKLMRSVASKLAPRYKKDFDISVPS
jgi:probable rRNA maturation factor